MISRGLRWQRHKILVFIVVLFLFFIDLQQQLVISEGRHNMLLQDRNKLVSTTQCYYLCSPLYWLTSFDSDGRSCVTCLYDEDILQFSHDCLQMFAEKLIIFGWTKHSFGLPLPDCRSLLSAIMLSSAGRQKRLLVIWSCVRIYAADWRFWSSSSQICVLHSRTR